MEAPTMHGADDTVILTDCWQLRRVAHHCTYIAHIRSHDQAVDDKRTAIEREGSW
jgi:hypothetical protein